MAYEGHTDELFKGKCSILPQNVKDLNHKMSFNHGFSNLNSCLPAFLFVFLFYYTNKINITLSFMFPRFLKSIQVNDTHACKFILYENDFASSSRWKAPALIS